MEKWRQGRPLLNQTDFVLFSFYGTTCLPPQPDILKQTFSPTIPSRFVLDGGGEKEQKGQGGKEKEWKEKDLPASGFLGHPMEKRRQGGESGNSWFWRRRRRHGF